jgi:hypothetical protein
MNETPRSPPIGPEALMAYADGELGAAESAALEQALATDPALRERVQRLRAQRARLQQAFGPELDEPVPERLSTILRGGPAAQARPALQAVAPEPTAVRAPQASAANAPHWMRWGGMAACLVAGVLLGQRLGGPGGVGEAALAFEGGRAVAGTPLQRALDTQLASEGAATASVAVQLSYLDRQGRYCRSFSLAATAGLACHEAGGWRVEQLVASEPAAGGALRQAASALPPALLEAAERAMAGSPLDAAAERRARDAGWRR